MKVKFERRSTIFWCTLVSLHIFYATSIRPLILSSTTLCQLNLRCLKLIMIFNVNIIYFLYHSKVIKYPTIFSTFLKTQYRRILTCARCNARNESHVKSQTTRATKLVNTIKVEHGKRYDRSSAGTKKCVGSNLNKMSNISATMQFKG